METVWFCIVAVMIATYVVLDGFDLGAGIVHLLVARGEEEKRRIARSIGPVWDGNEVWLLAAGGVLYFAFPRVYATSFSGFYLPLMMVLWLLILRAVALELRHHLGGPVWGAFWDRTFGIASALLAAFFGAALGNVVRGVPIDAHGRFFEPLWTHFGVQGRTGILDWYTVLVGAAAFLVLAHHGALWVVLKTDGELAARTRRFALRIWWPLALVVLGMTYATFAIQPHVPERLVAHPALFVFPALALAGLFAMRLFTRRGAEGKAFLASCLFIVGLLTSAVFGLYPYLLPANTEAARGLTVDNAHAPEYGLRVGLYWWIPGILLATGYFVFLYRRFAGKVELEGEGY